MIFPWFVLQNLGLTGEVRACYKPRSFFNLSRVVVMAKSAVILVQLVSTATLPDGRLTGEKYIVKKNPKKQPDKLQQRKYDKRIRKHVLFVEKKMPKSSA